MKIWSLNLHDLCVIDRVQPLAADASHLLMVILQGALKVLQPQRLLYAILYYAMDKHYTYFLAYHVPDNCMGAEYQSSCVGSYFCGNSSFSRLFINQVFPTFFSPRTSTFIIGVGVDVSEAAISISASTHAELITVCLTGKDD